MMGATEGSHRKKVGLKFSFKASKVVTVIAVER